MQLPDFPWDSLREAKRRAASHPDGLIDLSVGSPIDPTIGSAQAGLTASANAPGYPQTIGTPQLIAEMVAWWRRERNATSIDNANVLPVIGSKEMVALLPLLLGIRPGDAVVFPTISYPTYEVGARVAGATPVRADTPDQWPDSAKMVWINSPANPTGEVASEQALRELVLAARSRGIVLASDECYGLLGSSDQPIAPSALSDDVVGGDYAGVLALHSLSKQGNMAGYRAAFIAGDQTLIHTLTQVRKHLGLMVPTPIQHAVTAALADSESVAGQREVYTRRRVVLRRAFEAAGFRIDHSEAGLYLWATRGEDADASVEWCAARGVLVAPGHFYGEAGSSHIRVALTVPDEQAAAVAGRFAG